MDLAQTIGQRIKNMRKTRQMTLKQLSELTGLSSGFLSQFERGMTNIAIDSLNTIANALGVPLESLLKTASKEKGIDVIRSYEREVSLISPHVMQFMLSSQPERFSFLPRAFRLLPLPTIQKVELYAHEGQEFIYVLEGAVTFYLEDQSTVLYAGDSVHIDSTKPHNWANLSAMPALILTVNSPNPFLFLDDLRQDIDDSIEAD